MNEFTARFENKVLATVDAKATALRLAHVTVSLVDGKVTIDEGVTVDEAAREFWQAVAAMFPGIIRPPSGESFEPLHEAKHEKSGHNPAHSQVTTRPPPPPPSNTGTVQGSQSKAERS